MHSRLLLNLLLVAVVWGCDSTVSPKLEIPPLYHLVVEVRGVVLSPDGAPVSGIEVTGQGVAQFRQAVTDAEGQFSLLFTERDCFPASIHPGGEGVKWIWLLCSGCEQTVGSCSGTTTRKTVRYSG